MTKDSVYQARMSAFADLLNEMVTYADDLGDFVLAAKLEDARVAIIQRCDDVLK